MEEIFRVITAFLSGGWSRATEREAKWAASLRGLQACYRCEAADRRPAAYLTIAWSAQDRLTAAGVWLSGGDRCHDDASVSDWNIVVTDFHHTCLSAIDGKTLERLGLAEIGLLSEEISVADLMPPLLFELLDLITPRNREDDSWLNFYVAAFGMPHRLTSELLGLWLIDHGWGEESAESHARQFDFAQRLLARAESARQANQRLRKFPEALLPPRE